MRWKRSAVAACLAAGLGARWVGAQEPTPTPPPPSDAAAPPAPVLETQPKESFFGNRFALYLEVRGGASSSEAIPTSIEFTQNLDSTSSLEYQDIQGGEFTIGWTLPRDRGQYLFTYSVFGDGGYSLDATGLQRAYVDPSGGTPQQITNTLPWWHTTIRDGQLRSVQQPPTWDSALDDADGDGFPDPAEIRYPTTALDYGRSVPDDLGAQITTYDLYYRREFGGTRYHARWTAGARYLDVDAAVPIPIWINVEASVPGSGFTEGLLNPIPVTRQQSSGWGPVGSGEFQVNFFRRRLQLYALVRAAFIVQSSEIDSGEFMFLARDTGTGDSVPRQGRFGTKIDKSSWNSTFETGVRFRIVQGLHVFADWNKSGFLDPIIVPTKISLPKNSAQIDQPIGVAYKTEDVVLSTIQLGLSFQF